MGLPDNYFSIFTMRLRNNLQWYKESSSALVEIHKMEVKKQAQSNGSGVTNKSPRDIVSILLVKGDRTGKAYAYSNTKK